MVSVLPSEILGQPGVFNFLGELQMNQEIDMDKCSELLIRNGIKTPEILFEQLTNISIIFEVGNQFYLSPKGHKIWWLLKAINNGDLKEAIQRLNRLDPTLLPYEIVTEGMTAEFIHGLSLFPTFRRVLICSPWIYLKRKVLQKFSYAVYKAQEYSPKNKVEIIRVY